ncbi:ubiquinone biosynthesis accessory factor UbiJ [Marinobacter sp. X15-166B]|uniref:ubiquinone biosynthesis accessory factor UbiJ n=1 Tax=Marinobacter sp. X15-166B TaxID=1897620 RepID=UPI00085BFE79|nr:SCP2 sterol-binding domain-containing protein [Marinobacter sp. X15-166B]OEY65660.1 hypothetical protein BG841_03775 [Marinobacter sp. X15-166B]
MLPGPTLQAALTGILESALNSALALDPAGRQGLLTAVSGTLQFRITVPVAMTLTLQKSADRLVVGSQPAEQPALEISGPPLAFAALALGDSQVFADQRLAVEGDTALAHQFQRALDQLAPDWEAALAHRIGDLPAHFLGRRIRHAVNWSRNANASLQANVTEYLHEETRSLPGQRELAATFADIDELNLHTERLSARLDQLVSHLNSDSEPS